MSGPSMLYQIQAQAYNTATAYAPTATDSTPTTPPTFTPADLSAACSRKRAVVENLPTKCGHCGVGFSGTRCVVELKDGTVLFIHPDTSVPHYEQVCVFQAVEGHPSMSDPIYTMHGVMRGDVPCSRCGKTSGEHQHDYDTNGWRVARHETLSLPEDWPLYQPDGTWA